MSDGKTPGNGTTNPFGNGQGDVGAGGTKMANDFVKNPGGAGGPTAGHNFVEKGAQSPGGGKQGTVNAAEQPKEKQPEGALRCPESIPQGGIWPQPQLDQSARTPQRDLGTGPQGAPLHKPFKVSKT